MSAELAYLAGLIDGEGTFCIERKEPSGRNKTITYTATISVEMADREPIEALHNQFGGFFKGRRQRTPERKPTHTWKVSARKAENAIRIILPFLKISRKQVAANACLDLLATPHNHLGQGVRTPEHILERRQACYERCREANKRGNQSL